MEKSEILRICKENDFYLDRFMLDFLKDFEKKEFLKIINEIKIKKLNKKFLNKDFFEKNNEIFQIFSKNNEIFQKKVKISKNFNENFKKIKTKDFISYFRTRFKIIKNILLEKNYENLSSIRRIGSENGNFNIIGMVFNKKITKNKNLLIEIEDLTGKGLVLINKENKKLFKKAKNLLLDDIVVFNVSGSNKIMFANDFFYPDSILNSEKINKNNEFIAFCGDFHIGSNNFLENNLLKFINWLNGEVGDERERVLGLGVKYLFLIGDNIEGVGVYPEQEKYLKIKSCYKQYDKLADILGKIRKDVEIILCPGLHDAVWVGNPMPEINQKWSKSLRKLENLRFVSNPSLVNIGGLNFFVYYGSNFGVFINEIEDIRINFGNKNPVLVAEEILKRRCLAPVYGDVDIVPEKDNDYLVLENVPDIFIIGGQHRAMVGNYNNIGIISTSCWQTKTDFEKKIGAEPEPCRVPVLNLKNREIKILDFSENEVKWEEGDGLACKLEDFNNENCN